VSEGPIKAERDAWKPARVSTADADRVCLVIPPARRTYCGRRSPRATTVSLSQVRCSDCSAALRADGGGKR